jgi:flagellar hook-associated protein 3 FlgL
VMGNRQTDMQTAKTTLTSMSTALSAQLSGAEDVDMAATLSQLTATQAQLQASYQLISGLQGLSLVKFLPAGG